MIKHIEPMSTDEVRARDLGYREFSKKPIDDMDLNELIGEQEHEIKVARFKRITVKDDRNQEYINNGLIKRKLIKERKMKEYPVDYYTMGSKYTGGR